MQNRFFIYTVFPTKKPNIVLFVGKGSRRRVYVGWRDALDNAHKSQNHLWRALIHTSPKQYTVKLYEGYYDRDICDAIFENLRCSCFKGALFQDCTVGVN